MSPAAAGAAATARPAAMVSRPGIRRKRRGRRLSRRMGRLLAAPMPRQKTRNAATQCATPAPPVCPRPTIATPPPAIPLPDPPPPPPTLAIPLPRRARRRTCGPLPILGPARTRRRPAPVPPVDARDLLAAFRPLDRHRRDPGVGADDWD